FDLFACNTFWLVGVAYTGECSFTQKESANDQPDSHRTNIGTQQEATSYLCVLSTIYESELSFAFHFDWNMAARIHSNAPRSPRQHCRMFVNDLNAAK